MLFAKSHPEQEPFMAPDPEYFYIYRLLHFCIGYHFLNYLEHGFSAYF